MLASLASPASLASDVSLAQVAPVVSVASLSLSNTSSHIFADRCISLHLHSICSHHIFATYFRIICSHHLIASPLRISSHIFASYFACLAYPRIASQMFAWHRLSSHARLRIHIRIPLPTSAPFRISSHLIFAYFRVSLHILASCLRIFSHIFAYLRIWASKNTGSQFNRCFLAGPPWFFPTREADFELGFGTS